MSDDIVAAAAAADAERMAVRRAAAPTNASIFRGPCKDCCKPLACCCVGHVNGNVHERTLYGCVPIEHWDYFLPLCLHMCLCPQQGCDPFPTSLSRDQPKSAFMSNLGANLCGMCIQNSPGEMEW